MALEWEEVAEGKCMNLFADSNATSWKELANDLKAALIRMFAEMVERLEVDARYVLLMSLWHDDGRIIFQIYRRGRSLASTRLSLNIYCELIQDSFEKEMAGAPDDE